VASTQVTFEVAPCADLAEFSDAVFAIGQYFGMEPTEERMERFSKNLPIERMHAARENGTTVGGAGAFPFEMTVPGAIVPTAGVTVVGTYPTHRRRGVLRAMMRAQLDDVHERGEPLAALWASEETIYGRFGYGMASLTGSLSLARTSSAYAVPFEPAGSVRLVETDEALELFPQVWDEVRPAIPGLLSRSRNWWEFRILFDSPDFRQGAGPKRLVVLEADGRPEGYAIYRHRSKWEDGENKSELGVIEALALDGAATAQIWRYLFDVDWSARITADLMPVDHQLFQILATPRQMNFRVGDGLWVRLVDVGAALSARSYAADGAVVFDVLDAFCPWNEGRWKLEDGVAERTDADADLRGDVTMLGSAYLGFFTFEQLVRAGRVEELSPGAAARADAMFAWPRAPWCPEIF
jgi:predicted acetyltransferase